MRLLFVFIFVLARPALADSSVAPIALVGGDSGSLLATLDRHDFKRRFPSYSLTVYRDGRVEWQGRGHVALEGKARARLSAAELGALRAAFIAARPFELKGRFDCWRNTPLTVLDFYDDDLAIDEYHECRSDPAALARLAASFDRIVGSGRWVGAAGALR